MAIKTLKNYAEVSEDLTRSDKLDSVKSYKFDFKTSDFTVMSDSGKDDGSIVPSFINIIVRKNDKRKSFFASKYDKVPAI